MRSSNIEGGRTLTLTNHHYLNYFIIEDNSGWLSHFQEGQNPPIENPFIAMPLSDLFETIIEPNKSLYKYCKAMKVSCLCYNYLIYTV